MRALCAIPLVALASCAIGGRDVRVPEGQDAVVIVGSAALIKPVGDIARHPWLSIRDAGRAPWERWEVMCCPDDTPLSTVERSGVSPTSDHGAGGGDVQWHAVIRGRRAQVIAECVRRRAPRYPYRDEYQALPGPNSNTFIDWLIRECGIGVELPPTSIGKDYRGVVGVSTTAGGTGVQLETYVAGIKVGLTEGVEIHILGMSFGIDLWPPALIVPVGSGRIGFADR